MLIKPVFSDHLSYVTLFQCSFGKSHKISLTVITIFMNCKLQLCWRTRLRNRKHGNLSLLHYLSYICRKIFTFIRKLYSDTEVAFNLISAILSSPVAGSSVNGIFGSSETNMDTLINKKYEIYIIHYLLNEILCIYLVLMKKFGFRFS